MIAALQKEVERQIKAGATVFRAGGALGFDTLAAMTVVRYRQIYPHIRLELILPCPTQADNWAENDRVLYQEILTFADSYRYVSQSYFDGVLQMRNRQLVEGADVCIAYLTHSSGSGTAYTSALAIQSGLEFVNLAE
jgi:uncharacterized phage-like protein YoqJ